MKKRKKGFQFSGQAGQSLFEILMALSVTVLVITALAKVSVNALNNAQFARNQAQATQHARRAMEKMRAFRDENNWEDFMANCNSHPLFDPEGIFTLEKVCHLPDSESGCETDSVRDGCVVEIRVSWRDAHGEHGSFLPTKFRRW